MARKPKAAPTNDFANSPEGVLAALGDASAPARRGRKPKGATAAARERLATVDSDDAAGGTLGADDPIAGPVATPVRKRHGLKPKRRAGAAGAAPPQGDADPTPGREPAAADADPEPMPAASGEPDAGTDSQQQPRGPEPAMLEPAPASATSNAASSGSSQDAAPAAQWDRATDTVRFDWAAIERTASQGGPNQVMARLLVAARAEGANSRWPL